MRPAGFLAEGASRGRIGVVGTGPAGLMAALALAHVGGHVELFGTEPNLTATDRNARTAALFPPAIRFLSRLGVWEHCRDASAPLAAIRIVDDTGGLLRAPELTFTAAEAGFASLGHNIPNDALVRALWSAVKQAETSGKLQMNETSGVTDVAFDDAGAAILTAEGGRHPVALVVAADGRNSVVRSAASIDTETWPYEQVAITCTFDHGRPHNNISTELHRHSGPCTTVPLPGQRSSLVWVETPAVAERLLAMDDASFCAALSQQVSDHLGTVSHLSPRGAFPLSGLRTKSLVGQRVALVGETAHAIPPIAAQGLNLGVRDAAELAAAVATALADPQTDFDPGTRSILDAYDTANRAHVASRVTAVDMLNRSLLAGPGPVHLLKGAGLHVLRALTPLKAQLIRTGLIGGGTLPPLMCDETDPALEDQATGVA